MYSVVTGIELIETDSKPKNPKNIFKEQNTKYTNT